MPDNTTIRGVHPPSTTYRGIPVGAAPGVHEAAFALLESYLPRPARVLDLGTGAGAFLQRLLDHGYEAVGADITIDGFRPQAPVLKVDLNRPFAATVGAHPAAYAAVAAVEVIEHLENPRHLFRECSAVLARRGLLLVTTPHIESVHSRVKFLGTGRFEWFEESHYRSSGHITPLTQWQLGQIAAETEFELVGWSLGPPPSVSLQRRLVARLLRCLMRHGSGDDIRICLFRRRNAE